jgi:peptidoglycan/xylan/chitin deacetylase (PgdA/CDA1 family)
MFTISANDMMVAPALVAIPVAAGICAWSACHPSAQVFGPTRRRISPDGGLALTFDDGPNPAVTPILLDLLDQYDARATFFLIGRHVRACPELAAEIVRRGHSVGNHTDTHPNLLWQSRAQIRNELERCAAAIIDATGRRPPIMRPPYGYRSPQVHAAARDADLDPPIMWSWSGRDWTPQPVETLIHRLRRVAPGDIVLLHDGAHDVLNADRHHTVGALGHWLPRWKARGLQFISLSPQL